MNMNKTAFLISVILTTFVLMAVGGIAYTLRASENAQPAVDAVVPASPDPQVQAVDPAIAQAITEREAAYQQMIAEANARLEQAQQEQQALQSKLASLQASSPAAPQENLLTPDQAAILASNYLGNTSIYSIEVVVVRGENLYKVTFSSGDILYINMSGQVVGSEAAPQMTTYQVVRKGGGDGGGGEGEHEDDHDD
jgi:hypothetical protein